MITSGDLPAALLTAGIIQFGHFIDPDGRATPVRFQFELLPAYPSLLNLAAEAVTRQIENRGLQRLVCDQDSLPLAVCVDQKTRIPLIYNSEGGLAGAYDVGHPAALIGNVYEPQNANTLEVVRTRARRTGLELVAEIYLIGLSEVKNPTTQFLIMLDDKLLSRWVAQKWITNHQRETIQRWLEKQMTTHHRD
jgi:hypothetical protein